MYVQYVLVLVCVECVYICVVLYVYMCTCGYVSGQHPGSSIRGRKNQNYDNRQLGDISPLSNTHGDTNDQSPHCYLQR